MSVPAAVSRLLAGYPAAGDRFDELLASPAGEPRPHMRALFGLLASTPAQRIGERFE